VHRQEVERLTTEKEDLEKRLARQLRVTTPPAAAQSPAKPNDLLARLPAGVAFVDVFHYTHFEWDPKVPGRKGERRSPRYVAFVLHRDQPPVRVELDTAAVVDAAWAAWQKALFANAPGERRVAANLAGLVWQPLRKHLPAGLHTVYLAPDGELTRLPWAALPGRQPGSVLLEEAAVALV